VYLVEFQYKEYQDERSAKQKKKPLCISANANIRYNEADKLLSTFFFLLAITRGC
jgi:hypothetical protein